MNSALIAKMNSPVDTLSTGEFNDIYILCERFSKDYENPNIKGSKNKYYVLNIMSYLEYAYYDDEEVRNAFLKRCISHFKLRKIKVVEYIHLLLCIKSTISMLNNMVSMACGYNFKSNSKGSFASADANSRIQPLLRYCSRFSIKFDSLNNESEENLSISAYSVIQSMWEENDNEYRKQLSLEKQQ